jgi:hypothetical protein
MEAIRINKHQVAAVIKTIPGGGRPPQYVETRLFATERQAREFVAEHNREAERNRRAPPEIKPRRNMMVNEQGLLSPVPIRKQLEQEAKAKGEDPWKGWWTDEEQEEVLMPSKGKKQRTKHRQAIYDWANAGCPEEKM